MRSAAAALLLFLAALPATATSIINPGSSSPQDLSVAGTNVFFWANDFVHGSELWVTDGTPDGTHFVADLEPGAEGSLPVFTTAAVGNTAIVMTIAPNGRRRSIWRSDGTAGGTWRLLETPGAAAIYASGNHVFIVSNESGTPVELWISDGSAVPQKILTLPRSSFTGPALLFDGRFYFTVRDQAGTYLWTSDGTMPGTHVLEPGVECPGLSCPPLAAGFFRFGSDVFFAASGGGLWKTDGTAAGTVRITDVPHDAPKVLAKSATTAYLTGDGALWRTDGTAAGTRKVGALTGESWSATVLNSGRAYLIRTLHSSSGFPIGSELWTTDGTSAPVSIIAPPDLAILASGGSRVWVRAGSISERELMVVDDGSVPRIIELDPRRTIPPASGSPAWGALLGGRLLFAASGISGRELWISDGTEAGTRMLANIAPDPPSGTIGGFVRDATSKAGIAAATLTLCTPSACGDAVTTAPDGGYSFDNVIPGGAYTVKVTAPAYVTQSAAVAVTAGNTTAHDFELLKGSIVSGSVRRASTGESIAAGTVAILDGSGTVIDVAQSTAGTFSTKPLAIGTYYAEARGFTNAVDQRFRGVNCPAGCNAADGEPIAVTSAADIAGIDFLLHDYGTIAGTILDTSSGRPAAGVHVAFQIASLAKGEVVTGFDGRYVSPPLAPGSYTVVAKAGNGLASAVYATPVAVTMDGAVTGIDLAVRPDADRSRLAGVIRDSAGAPVAGLSVTLLPFDARDMYGSSTTTAADGAFAIFDLTPGTYYLLAARELYGGVDCLAWPCSLTGAIALPFTAGRTTAVDMQLRSRKTIVSGRVVDGTTGQPVSDSVYLVTAAGTWVAGASAVTGTFSISGLSREPLYLFATAFTGADGVFYPNVRTACRTTPCSVPAGAQAVSGTMTGVVLPATRLGTISGHIDDALTGEALYDVQVSFQKADGTAAGTARSDYQSGKYEWAGADGSYFVYCNAQRHLFELHGQVYRDHDCIPAPCVPASGDVVVTPAGTATSGIDFHLKRVVPTGIATGRVVDALTGQPLSGVYVDPDPLAGSSSEGTDATGTYTIRAPIGPHSFSARPPNPYLEGRSSTVIIAADTTTTVPELRLQRLRITSVSPTSGSPLGGTRITVQGGNFPDRATLKIGGIEALIVKATATEITAMTPPGPAGPAHVTVSEPTLTKGVTLLHAFWFDPAAAPPSEPAGANLSVTMSASRATFSPGDSVIYTIRIRNEGPWPATGVWIHGSLPPAATFAGLTSDATLTCYQPPVQCVAPATLASGATIELRVTVTVAGTEPIMNSISASADEPDMNVANNTAMATIIPQAPPPPPPPDPVSIPTLGTTALLALAAVLAALAWLRMRG